jgi:hypothetical protein
MARLLRVDEACAPAGLVSITIVRQKWSRSVMSFFHAFFEIEVQ